MPRVCIGIPTYNRPDLVRETINSVLKQTYSDFRAMVSDNRSEARATDSVRSFVDSVADERFVFHLQDRNEGEYGQARYFMDQASNSDYFMILHDDDLLDHNYLEKAVRVLENHPEISLFFANPRVIDETGATSAIETRKYHENHGREKTEEGTTDVLEGHLSCGLIPVSGTLFRTSIFRKSGFIDDQASGNYPFECDLLLRLGDIRASAWFCKEKLISFRFHRTSMRNYINLMENPEVVTRMIEMFSSRQYSGKLERHRRVMLGRFYRANAFNLLRQGEYGRGRSSILQAMRKNILSPKAWLAAPFIVLIPGILRSLLPELPEYAIGPEYSELEKED